ncbi:hypothetical protein [Roseisalinus antarcticus]|uniref:FlgN protein n=1 Tax=Roseisalinus antarcticus TaxID=254357 RepID=A0A1Y5TGM3_9RHOB|nr:hypothetical protein [Roseisalinus antarcticus]SLN63202.1 FlgN protein [Roseisalinus antarcticus]
MTDTVMRLRDLLESEREALLSGDLRTVGRLGAEKLDLVEGLETAPAGDGTLREIAELSARNQSLIAAALDGTRSVVRRLGQLKDVQSQLTTYDANGRKAQVLTASVRSDRKA